MKELLLHGVGFLSQICLFIGAILLANRLGKKPLGALQWSAIAGCALLLIATGIRLSTPPSAFYDFLFAYYPAGLAVVHGNFAALRAITGPVFFVNMPVVAYLFAPFALLPPRVAIYAYSLVGIGFAIGAWIALVKANRLESRDKWILAVLFIANGPMLSGIMFGNTSYFILLALALGFTLVRSNRSWSAGAVLGLSAILKPPLLLFGFLFLLQRDWKGLSSFVLTCVATALVSITVFGLDDNVHWVISSLLPFQHSWVAGFTVQSIPAFLIRLSANPSILTDWSLQTPSLHERLMNDVVLGVIVAISVVANTMRFSAIRPASEHEIARRDLQYLLILCLCIVLSPLNWAHYYAWLLVPAASFLKLRTTLSPVLRSLGWAAMALVTPLVMWPVHFSNASVMKLYSMFFSSHILFGGLLWFCVISWLLARSPRQGLVKSLAPGLAVASTSHAAPG